MKFRAKKDFEFHGQRGNTVRVHRGNLVDVLNRHEADTLMAEGKIEPVRKDIHTKRIAPPLQDLTATKRVGVWLRSSSHYSGGRLHMFQYIINMALAGAEVFFISNQKPLWRQDYKHSEKVIYVLNGEDPPDDLDIAMTDSKGRIGVAAKNYCEDHDRCRFVCLNFETANWTQKYVESIAKNMRQDHMRDGYEAADMLLGNSRLSKEHLKEWMGETGEDRRYGILPPAINTHSIGRYSDVELPDRPYAVWAARNTGYKCIDTSIEAVWSLDIPFDLVTFGEPGRGAPDSPIHKMHGYKNFDDAAKYKLFKHAHCVLAPSLFEGFGMVPGEALAVGTLPICYELPVLREVYGDRPEYVEWGNEEKYKAKVKETIETEIPQMAEDSKWVKKQYGMNAMADRIERLPWHGMKDRHIDACMICYGTPTAPYAVESVYDDVENIRIAYGPTPFWSDFDDGDMLQRLREMPDPDNKITIEARTVWEDKLQMRSYLADQITGNYQLVLDADELWVGLDEFDRDFATPKWVNFWHDIDHWIVDDEEQRNRWGVDVGAGSVCPHYRYSWWRPSYKWGQHYMPKDYSGEDLKDNTRNRRAAKECETTIYHLGHAMPREYMDRKHRYYQHRDGADRSKQTAWQRWDGQCGPMGDGIVQEWIHEIPAIVREAYNDIT